MFQYPWYVKCLTKDALIVSRDKKNAGMSSTANEHIRQHDVGTTASRWLPGAC
jgi:hypothetical protein